jgi:hypothetical protein
MPYLAPDTAPTTTRTRTLSIPDDVRVLGAVNGALLELTYPQSWEQTGAVTPDEIAELMLIMFLEYLG